MHLVDATEQKILDAAVRTFIKEGYAGTTTRRIAEEAGVNEVTLFRKFKSKENILIAAIDRSREEFLKIAEGVFSVESGMRFPESLYNIGRSLKNAHHKKFGLMTLLLSEAGRVPEAREALRSIPEAMIGRLSEYLEEQIALDNMRNVDPKAVSTAFMGYIFYTSLLKEIEYDTGDDEQAYRDYFESMLHGICKK